MKKRLKIISLDSRINYHFLGLFEPDDTEGISNDIYSVLKDVLPESTAKSESLRIARILKDKTIYHDNTTSYSFYEDIIKYYVEVGNGNYIEDFKDKSFTNDYRNAYLFYKDEVEEVRTYYNDMGKRIKIKEVNRDPNLYKEICGFLERVYSFTINDDFIKSQKDDYFYETIQRYIHFGTSFKGLACSVASRMFQDVYEYQKSFALIGKVQPN